MALNHVFPDVNTSGIFLGVRIFDRVHGGRVPARDSDGSDGDSGGRPGGPEEGYWLNARRDGDLLSNLEDSLRTPGAYPFVTCRAEEFQRILNAFLPFIDAVIANGEQADAASRALDAIGQLHRIDRTATSEGVEQTLVVSQTPKPPSSRALDIRQVLRVLVCFEENVIPKVPMEEGRHVYLDMTSLSDENLRCLVGPEGRVANIFEAPYLAALGSILRTGEEKPDRTGVGTLSNFGVQMSFSLEGQFPLLTTKRIFHRGVFEELAFFIGGETDTKRLEAKGVGIWKANTSREFLDKRALDYPEGVMGPMYGYQWRFFGRPYVPPRSFDGGNGPRRDAVDAESRGADQLKDVIEAIKTDPHSRRHVVSAWNPLQQHEMVLAPCHVVMQFNVSGDGKKLDCILFQRSGDMFLGVPFNIASYAALTYLVAHLTGLKPRKLVHTIGDAHVYTTHVDAVHRQLQRTPRPPPQLAIDPAVRSLDDVSAASFVLSGYDPHPAIKAEMAI